MTSATNHHYILDHPLQWEVARTWAGNQRPRIDAAICIYIMPGYLRQRYLQWVHVVDRSCGYLTVRGMMLSTTV
jgi:hypothetical protein